MSTDAITPEELLAHSAWLQRLAARLVEPGAAEDLVQETWAAAVHSQPDRDRPLRPWLAEVLRNLARMRARGSARWRARAEEVRVVADVPLPTPEELLTYHEAQRMVAEEVARLEEPFRSAVLLCYGQGMEPSEIARKQGIPAGTVRWRLKRGLDDVRTRLDARYGHDRRAWCAVLAPLAARGVVGGATGVAVFGARGLVFKTAVAVLAVAAGVAAVRWARSRPSERLAALSSDEQPAERVTPARRSPPRLIGAAPAPGAPGAGRPGGALPALAAAAPSAEGRLDVTEALKRAAEPGDAPSRGNPKAPVTIVMYSEFQCPFCARVLPTLGELEAQYPQEVRFVWRNLPLPFHDAAGLASEAAMAAGEQGKFWPMYERLFANQDKLDPPSLVEHAKVVGLDVGKFKAALDSGKFRQRVEADIQLAKEANIGGTPTFLINGVVLTGAQPLPAFKQKVEEALAKARGLPPPPPPAATAPPPGKPGMPRGPIMSPFWPPPKVALPDALLGDKLAAPITIGNAPLRGSPKAPIEVLYFTTLTCGQCANAAQVLDGLVQTYGPYLRIYAKVMPTNRPNETGPSAAEAAMAAHAAGKFWPFHDALTHGKWGVPAEQRLEDAARAAGLDPAELMAAVNSGRYRARALEEAEALRGTRIGETAFVVNGRLADGNVALLLLIEAAIKKAGKKPPPWPTPAGGKDPNGLFGQKGPPGGPIFQPMPFLHVSPRQLFTVEPRDDVWAAAVEKQLGPLMDRDLRAAEPKLAQTRLECRTTMCRLSWQPGKGDARAVASTVGFIYGQPTPTPQSGNERYLMLRSNAPGQDASDAAVTSVAGVKSRRSTVLYKVRTGRAAAPPGVPAERLPKE